LHHRPRLSCDSQGRLCRDRHSHSLAFPTSRHRFRFRLLTLPCCTLRTELLLVAFSYLLSIGCFGSLLHLVTSRLLVHSLSLIHPFNGFTPFQCYILVDGSLQGRATSLTMVHFLAMYPVVAPKTAHIDVSTLPLQSGITATALTRLPQIFKNIIFVWQSY